MPDDELPSCRAPEARACIPLPVAVLALDSLLAIEARSPPPPDPTASMESFRLQKVVNQQALNKALRDMPGPGACTAIRCPSLPADDKKIGRKPGQPLSHILSAHESGAGSAQTMTLAKRRDPSRWTQLDL